MYKYLKHSLALAGIAILAVAVVPRFVDARATVQNTTMPDGTVGQAYSTQFTATSDYQPITFQKWYWTYPGNEMTLSSSGLFSGTPTQAGTYEVGLRVEDGTGDGIYAEFTWKVNGTSTSTSGNTLTVSQDTTLANTVVAPGAPSYIFSAFNLKAGATAVTLGSIRVVSDSSSNTYLSDIKITKDKTQQVGSTSGVLGGVSGSTRYATFTFSPAITIPANGTVLFELSATTSSSTPNGQIRLGLDSPTFTGTAPTISPSLPIYDDYITVSGSNGGGSATNPTLVATVTPAACTATTAVVLVTVNGTSGTSYTVNRNGASLTAITGSGTYSDNVAIGASQTYTLFANNVQIGTAQTVTGSKQSSCGANGTTVTITTNDTLPEGAVGQQYSQTLQASGGTAAYTWSVTNGVYNLYPCCYVTLSSGGIFSANTSNNGYLPFAGTYQLPVTVIDAAGVSAQKVLSFTIKPSTTPTPTSTPTPTATPRNEGYIDVLSATNVSGWAYTNVPKQGQVPAVVITFENVSDTSKTFNLNLQPTVLRADVNTYLQNKYGGTVSVATGFSGNPSSVINTNGTYRIKSATYDGIGFVLSEAAKRSFAIGTTTGTSGPINKYVKVSGDPTVYWTTSWGGKMPIMSAAVFASYGGKFEDVVTITQEVLDNYDDVEYIKRANDARVYKIEGSVKRYLTPAAATRLNIDPARVVTVNETEFFSYRTGSTIQ